MNVPTGVGAAVAVGAVLALWPAAAVADQAQLNEYDWRRSARQGQNARARWLDTTHFLVEIRFGPYWPEVDEEFEDKPNPFSENDPLHDLFPPYEGFFGSGAQFYFGLEFDYLPVNVPYLGGLGIAFGWGYTKTSANTRLRSDPSDTADSESSFSIMPMHLSGVFRLDYPLRHWSVPLVPYVKVGLGFGVWSASGPNNSNKGTTLGTHFALGGTLMLNAFDPSAAATMREDSGIDYAFIFGEWMWANLDGIGSYPLMHVGTSTVVVGLGLDW